MNKAEKPFVDFLARHLDQWRTRLFDCRVIELYPASKIVLDNHCCSLGGMWFEQVLKCHSVCLDESGWSTPAKLGELVPSAFPLMPSQSLPVLLLPVVVECKNNLADAASQAALARQRLAGLD